MQVKTCIIHSQVIDGLSDDHFQNACAQNDVTRGLYCIIERHYVVSSIQRPQMSKYFIMVKAKLKGVPLFSIKGVSKIKQFCWQEIRFVRKLIFQPSTLQLIKVDQTFHFPWISFRFKIGLRIYRTRISSLTKLRLCWGHLLPKVFILCEKIQKSQDFFCFTEKIPKNILK